VPAFAELLGRTCFSFLRGASHPEELVSRARELGLSALAVCDRDGLYGSARVHAAALEMGQRVIVGAELTVDPTVERKGSWRSATTQKVVREAPVLALLVETHEGYSNLCRLLTLAHADLPKSQSYPSTLKGCLRSSRRHAVREIPRRPPRSCSRP
jgi:error-prone DNA polymerase